MKLLVTPAKCRRTERSRKSPIDCLDEGNFQSYCRSDMPATIETYPGFEEQVRELVEQHRKSKKQRLRLAVYFAPPRRAKRDVFLFEVIEGFGGDVVDPEEKLFDFAYGSTPAFPLARGSSLRVILTNPTELAEAVQGDWKGIQELRMARKAGRATVIYADAEGKRLWEMIK
jgi:hypothetical protein